MLPAELVSRVLLALLDATFALVERNETPGTRSRPVELRSFFLGDSPETMPKAANITALQTLARASGGKFCEFNELNPTLSALHFAQQEEQRVIYRTLWNNWVILAALVSLLVVEWALRRWRNLA